MHACTKQAILKSRCNRLLIAATCTAIAVTLLPCPAFAQAARAPDTGQPGDAMIQAYLAQEAATLEAGFLQGIESGEDWLRERPRLLKEYYHMVGLSPMPEKTPLHTTITGTLDRGDYVVDMLHYQSVPGLYVTGNLYRPAKVAAGEKLPAIFYVCGHSFRPRNGNKTAYQSHGIWFARHGYVCLIVDTLQLGEIEGIHHGTYREGRWWWLSRGYTPTGVECWNGIRGIDYLSSRDDVDPGRIGVTGISGGGAVTFWIAAADERVRAAAPVSGTADLTACIPNLTINEHCDCIFLYNTYQWPWAYLASLIAPRPLLFMNSDRDGLCPMDSNERLVNRLERTYSLLGVSDKVDAVISVGPHAYRQDLRQAAFRFMNLHLKGDPGPVLDSEVDLVEGPRGKEVHPIPPERLRVFPEDSDFPADARNGRIDQEFVPMAQVALPAAGAYASWKSDLLADLRELTFHHFPDRVPQGTNADGESDTYTEPGIRIRMRRAIPATSGTRRVVLFVTGSDLSDPLPDWLETNNTDAAYICEPRGIGGTQWTRKDPPNYVERCHFLLGRTVDSGRVWDIAAAARYLKSRYPGADIHLAGEGASAVLAAYAALLEEDVAGLVLAEPPATHMDVAAPAMLNALRVCDIPELLGMVAPRPLTLLSAPTALIQRVAAVYRSADAENKLTLEEEE